MSARKNRVHVSPNLLIAQSLEIHQKVKTVVGNLGRSGVWVDPSNTPTVKIFIIR